MEGRKKESCTAIQYAAESQHGFWTCNGKWYAATARTK